MEKTVTKIVVHGCPYPWVRTPRIAFRLTVDDGRSTSIGAHRGPVGFRLVRPSPAEEGASREGVDPYT